ncbi:hypothetical protein BHM03_00018378 [Ensete ventricosum]|nr:hypothetical protein BHM03_00018378 [Ensete ventricosum]
MSFIKTHYGLNQDHLPNSLASTPDERGWEAAVNGTGSRRRGCWHGGFGSIRRAGPATPVDAVSERRRVDLLLRRHHRPRRIVCTEVWASLRYFDMPVMSTKVTDTSNVDSAAFLACRNMFM